MAENTFKICQDIIKDIKNRKFAPVYFLQGDENYFIDLISNAIENEILNEAEKGFNQTILYGKDTNVLDIMMMARRFPMMSEYQVILVKEAQNLKDWEKLIPYLQNPVPSTILAFAHKEKKLDKKTKAAKEMLKHIWFESKALYENQVPDWIETYVKNAGYSIDNHASLLVAQSMGADLSNISNELNKVFINLSKGARIGVKEIEENVGISREYNVFELQEAVGRKDFKKSLEIALYLGGQSGGLIMTISTMYGYFSKLYKIHYLKDKSRDNVAKTVGLAPFIAQNYINAAQKFQLNELEYVFSIIKEFDLKSKGINDSGSDVKELLKEFILKIFGGRVTIP